MVAENVSTIKKDEPTRAVAGSVHKVLIKSVF